MQRNFYYQKDATAVTGSATFANLLTTTGSTLGVPTPMATAYAGVDATLQAAYAVAIEPSTRTKSSISRKNIALAAMRAAAIPIAKLIYANPSVSNPQLIDLGLLPRPTRAPVPPQHEPPVVEVEAISNRLVSVRIHPKGGSSRRGRPAGTVGANVYSYVGPTVPTDPRAFFFEGMTTRSITQIQFPDSVAGGAIVWLSACWVSARGATSPACTPVSFSMQGGGSLPAEVAV